MNEPTNDEWLANSQRIIIVGTSGSGKTTLAAQLGVKLGLPHIELDALHWEPNWTEAPLEVFRERVTTALAGPGWIVDGNYSKVRDIIWLQADTLIWLDYSLPLVMSRIIRRTVYRGVSGHEMWNGNRERWQNIFKTNREENIILWALTTHRRRQREMPELIAQPQYSHLKTLRLRSPREATALLDQATR